MKAAGYSDSYMSVVVKAYTTEDHISRFDSWDSINQSDVKVATTLGTTFEKNAENWFPNSQLTVGGAVFIRLSGFRFEATCHVQALTLSIICNHLSLCLNEIL